MKTPLKIELTDIDMDHKAETSSRNVDDLELLRDLLLVKPEEGDMRIGSLHIPDKYVPDSVIGRIIAVGPDCANMKVGEKIFWTKYAGAKLEFNRIEYRIMREIDVTAKVRTKILLKETKNA